MCVKTTTEEPKCNHSQNSFIQLKLQRLGLISYFSLHSAGGFVISNIYFGDIFQVKTLINMMSSRKLDPRIKVVAGENEWRRVSLGSLFRTCL